MKINNKEELDSYIKMQKNEIIWFTFANFGYREYIKNFLESSRRYKTNFILHLLCSDDLLFNEIGNDPNCYCIRSNLFFNSNLTTEFRDIDNIECKKLMSCKLDVFSSLLKYLKSFNINMMGYIDTDIILLKNPTELFLKISNENPNINIFAQCDENANECYHNLKCPNPCTGVLLFKYDDFLIQLLDYKTLGCEVTKFQNNEQDYLKYVCTKTNYPIYTITKKYLANGTLSGLKNNYPINIPESIYCLHFNWMVGNQKKEYMKKNNLWFI